MKVVVLSIWHRHGTNVYVAETEELARELLYVYVKQWWDDIGSPKDGAPEDCPKDKEQAINIYFSEFGREDESYEISDPQEITTKANLEKHKKGV